MSVLPHVPNELGAGCEAAPLEHALLAASAHGAVALVHVDTELRVIERDGRSPGRELLRDSDAPVLIDGERLVAREACDAERLTGAVQLAFAGQGSSLCFGPPGAPLVVGFAPSTQQRHLGSERTALVLFFTGQPPLHCEALAGLSPALRQVALCLVRGASDKDIARELGTSVATARTYTSRVLARLGVRDRRELMKRR